MAYRRDRAGSAAICVWRRSYRDRATSPRSRSPTVSAVSPRAAALARAAGSVRPCPGGRAQRAKRAYFSPADLAAFQSFSPATASSRCRKSRSHRRRAAHFGGVTEDDIVRAEQLREVMRGKPDPSLRQVEAELMPHRPAEPWIDPWRRRPAPSTSPPRITRSALREPRLQRTINFSRASAGLWPPHRAVGECGLKYLGYSTSRTMRPLWRLSRADRRTRPRAPSLVVLEGDRRTPCWSRDNPSRRCDGARNPKNRAVWSGQILKGRMPSANT